MRKLGRWCVVKEARRVGWSKEGGWEGGVRKKEIVG